MIKKTVPMTLVLILSFLVTFGTPLAVMAVSIEATRTAGVKVGDWVKYGNFTALYGTDDPNATETPSEIVEHDNIGWIENTVVNISGSRVTFDSVIYFENNNTEAKSVEKVDIETGYSSSELRAIFMFVSTDLGEGDSIYASGEFVVYKINETISRDYIRGISRKTNHWNGSTITPVEEDQYVILSVNYYWDKETGVLCEYLGSGYLIKGNYTTSWEMSYEIIETNISWAEQNDGQDDGLPDAPEGYSPVTIGVVVIIVFVPVVFFLWRRKGRKHGRK